MSERFKLGKAPAVFDTRTLIFGKYLLSSLPSPPSSKDWGKLVAKWPMFANDKYGDCTCAAAGHMIQDWTANAGAQVTPTQKAVIEFYEHFVGKPPPPDEGCNMLDVLKYWRSGPGLGGHKIAAFVAVEPKNHVQAMDAVALLGCLYVGVELPDFAVRGDMLQVPWVVPPQGPVGDAAPNSANGHCIPAVAYDDRNLYVITWGAVKAMSWQFYDAYSDEAYAVLSQDFLRKNKAPNGFDLKALMTDLSQIGSVPSGMAGIVKKRSLETMRATSSAAY
jgi:hypothetical protein